MGRESEPLFREEQGFRQARTRILLAIPPAGLLLLLIWQVVLGHPWGRRPVSNANIIGWTIFLWLIYLRLITVKLVTEVRPDRLSVSLRGLWRVRHIPWAEIKSAEVVRYDAAKDYGGYGIRSTRSGKAYIADGDQGVRLRLTKGGNLLVGSQRPAELAGIVTRLIGRTSGV